MGSKGQQQTQTTSSTSAPWAPTQPLLTDLIAKMGGMNIDVTGDQSAALNALKASTGTLPSFGTESADAISKIFQTSGAPQIGMLTDAYSTLQQNLSGTASGTELDPYKTPGFATALDTLSGDITDRVKGIYAAAGRDPSGAGSFAGSLGRGLTEGLAPVLANQYNQNKAAQMDAAKTLLAGAGSTASGVTGAQGFEIDSLLKAIGAQGSAIDAFTKPASTQLDVANLAQALPWSNLGQLLNPLVSIAGLGGQTSGTSTVSQKTDPLSNIIGGTTAALGLGKLLFSDERLKDDIEEVGMLHDGQPVYRYRMKGSPAFQIGLLAQDVAEETPEAVYDFGNTGLLAVDYEAATDRAADMRMAA